MRVGIFGGSFNPIHRGHLTLAKTALSELNLDKVIFVPSFRTPLKKEVLFLPAAQRLRFLKEAIKGCKRFEVSDWELKRARLTYTIEAVRYFKKIYGPKSTLFFLAGSDTLKNLSRWKSLNRVLKLCRFCVFTRPGYPLKKRISNQIIWVPMEALDISATDIRKLTQTGKSLAGLIPKNTELSYNRWSKGESSSIPKKRSR